MIVCFDGRLYVLLVADLSARGGSSTLRLGILLPWGLHEIFLPRWQFPKASSSSQVSIKNATPANPSTSHQFIFEFLNSQVICGQSRFADLHRLGNEKGTSPVSSRVELITNNGAPNPPLAPLACSRSRLFAGLRCRSPRSRWCVADSDAFCQTVTFRGWPWLGNHFYCLQAANLR